MHRADLILETLEDGWNYTLDELVKELAMSREACLREVWQLLRENRLKVCK